jgi:hypothetical protein
MISTGVPGNSAAVSNCTLYYIYGANDLANEMLVLASTDGTTWQGPKAYLGVQMGAAGPAATGFGTGVTVGFQSKRCQKRLVHDKRGRRFRQSAGSLSIESLH